MKYDESFSSNRKRVSTGLIILLAFCLVLIGGALWFALSRDKTSRNGTDGISSVMPPADNGSASSYHDGGSSYNDSASSYNESVPNASMPESPTAPTGNGVESEPYGDDSAEVKAATDKVIAFTMPVQGEILKNFSLGELQYSKTFGDMRLHSAVDIACKKGTGVSACSEGTVLSIDLNTSYGNVIAIDHSNGLVAKYSAIDNIEVKVGDKVTAGDILGTTATVPAECNDAEHLHFEIYKDGIAVHPLEALGLE